MHRNSLHKAYPFGTLAEDRASGAMCKALHRRRTANEQSQKK